MGIKSKRTGPAPIYSERWQVLATDPDRIVDTLREYRLRNPGIGPVPAMRTIREFHRKHLKNHVPSR